MSPTDSNNTSTSTSAGGSSPSEHISKSWGGHGYYMPRQARLDHHHYSMSPTDQALLRRRTNDNLPDNIFRKDFKPYDAISNCKSAGVIPYAIHNGELYFLLQQTNNPLKKKDSGWNDFGGKRVNLEESTAETAAREFSEETSCLFYLREKNDDNSKVLYERLKDNESLEYDDETVKILRDLIPISKNHYVDKITEFVIPIYISSKETYISYFVNVDYIPIEDLPRAEDIHIPYDTRYIRRCKWLSYDEILDLNEKDFHKRLQITRIQQRIRSYYEKGLFT